MRILGGVLAVALLLGAWGGTVDAQLIERYMKGYQGPYRARVVDEETKEPLPGTAILVIWEYDKLEFLHSRVTFHDARETLTDTHGDFTIDAPEVEKHLPSRTLKPRFVVFKPGYASEIANFLARGETIKLRRLRSRSQRLESIRSLPPGNVPDEKMRSLIRVMNIEEVGLGLEPSHLQEGK